MSQSSDDILCPGCGRPNLARADFCTSCRAPLSWHATTDPMGTIFAEGYAARRALTQPPRPIIVLGVWLWMLPLAIISVVTLIVSLVIVGEGLRNLDLVIVFGALLAAAVFAVLLYIAGKVLFTVTRNYVQSRKASSLTATGVTPGDGGRTPPARSAGGAASEQVTCLACGESLPPGAAECVACGWSYIESKGGG